MRSVLFTIILLAGMAGCKKEALQPEDKPAGNTPYLLATFEDEPFPKLQNWDNGIQNFTVQDHTILIVTTHWGIIDTTFVNGDPRIIKLVRMGVQLRRSSDSPSELSRKEQIYEMIKPRKVKYCSAAPFTNGVSISVLDEDFRSWRSEYGDNADSYFLITGRGDPATTGQTITYSAAFSCRVYDDFGNSKILKGDFNSVLAYFE